MTAVTQTSQAWVQCAGIAAVVTPLYLAFIFRNFVWKRLPQTIRTITVATWGRATKRHADDATPPASSATSFKDNPNYLEWSWPNGH